MNQVPTAASGEETPMIRIRDLVRSIGSQEILKGVSLEVKQGEVLCVIGRSGGGKSVLLKHIVGLLRADQGSIQINGVELTGKSERQLNQIRESIGLLFQGAALFDSLTVFENVAFPLREKQPTRPSFPEIEKRVMETLRLLGLEGHQEKLPGALSGGMKKRVGLARAIIGQPTVVLYDEPSAGLDPISSDSINRLILTLKAQLGVTSVVVTHDMTSVFAIADQVAFLHEGRIAFHGSPEELKQCRIDYVCRFVEGRAKEEEEPAYLTSQTP